MKKILLALLLSIFAVPAFGEAYSPKKLPSLRVVEDFSQYEIGKFPKSFRTYPLQRGKAEQVYLISEEDGNKILHALDDKDFSVQAFKRFLWEAKRWPNFSWKWRAVTLPKGGEETNGAPNDSACGIYVTFGGYTGNAIKYVWSSTLPAGTVVEKKPGKFYILVLDSGPGSVGSWVTKTVNIVEDYKRLFKAEPTGDPDGFGILTDGNATHTPSACDYDDFRISETPF